MPFFTLLYSIALSLPRTEALLTEFGPLLVRSRVETSTQTVDDDRHPVSLSVESLAGEPLLLLRFRASDSSGPNAPRFAQYALPGLPTPVIIVVVLTDVGGSDCGFESTLIGVISGQVRDLLPEHIPSSLRDAICIVYGPDRSPALLAIRYLWEDDAHSAPHRYLLTEYRWEGNGFSKHSSRRTRYKHPSWKDAARELGYHVRHDFIRSLTPGFRDE